jgi:F-type H+-transporting ATPase subunit gamma
MKALAAVNIRQYERAVEALTAYSGTVEMAFQVLLKSRRFHYDEEEVGPDVAVGAVVIGTDQGMAGSLNEQVVGYALSEMGKEGVPPRRAVIAVGGRAAGGLEDAGQPVETALGVPGSASAINDTVLDLLVLLHEWRFKRGIGTVLLFYSMHLSGARYQPATLRLLPLDRAWVSRLERKKWVTKALPAFTMDVPTLLKSLIRHYLFVSLYRVLAQSLASENASRLASMQGAEKSIEERLDEFRARYRNIRQTSITEEMLDIISGYEALKR